MKIKFVVIFIAAISICLAAGFVIRNSKSSGPFTPPGNLYDIGGYRLHLQSRGSGGHAVIMEAGSGDFSATWALVAPKIAQANRVYTYDRAGLGWSEKSPYPRLATIEVAELHALLQKAGVKPPYILVGHSLGGVLMRLFAYTYPAEVEGMVLVDPSHEEQETAQEPEVRSIMEKSFASSVKMLSGYAEQAEKGTMEEKDIKAMINRNVPAKEKAQYLYIFRSKPEFWRTVISEMQDIDASFAAVKARHITSLGSIPLVVISSSATLELVLSPGLAVKADKVIRRLQKGIARESSYGKYIIAKGTTHFVQMDRPQAVIDAINSVINSLDARPDLDDPLLDAMVKKEWTAHAASKPAWKGQVSVYIMTPKGNYFSSSDLKSKVDSHYHFRGASTTKMFTAAAIMLLQQQGKLNINDLITANIPGSSEPYVPDTASYAIPYKDKITIRLLLKHRAGVWDVSNNDVAGRNYVEHIKSIDKTHNFTFDELVGVVAANKLSFFAPDASYHYSDTGYSILGKIIERVSGKSYGQFIKDSLLTPNGLKETSFPRLGSQKRLPKPFLRGFSVAGSFEIESTEDNMSPHIAEGNVITTSADLGRWVRRLLRGEAGVSSDCVALMTAGTKDKKYGLGLSYVPGLGYGHDGGHAGYSTVAKYDPEQDVTVIIAASAIDFLDLVGYYGFLHDIGRKAKNILGYSTAEASTNKNEKER